MLLAASAVLNGDWRKTGKVTHICLPGCCQSPHVSLLKAQAAVKELLKAVRPRNLARANWLEWTQPLNFMLFGYIHDLLPRSFDIAFGSATAEEAVTRHWETLKNMNCRFRSSPSCASVSSLIVTRQERADDGLLHQSSDVFVGQLFVAWSQLLSRIYP